MARPIKVAKDYDAATLGAVMNYVTRELNVRRHAFDMKKLNKIGMLLPHVAVAVQTVDAHAYSTSSQESSSSSTSTKGGFKTPMTRASLEHHTSTGQSQLDTASGMSLTASMSYRDYQLELTDISAERLYGCATDDFQKALQKLVSAQEALAGHAAADAEKTKLYEAWQAAYRDFTKGYGHGFVSGLKLISCAVCEFHTSYIATGNDQQRSHGTSMAVGFKKVGGSHAKNWAEEEKQKHSDGSMSGTSEAFPTQSSCASWVSACLAMCGKNGLTTISEQGEFPAPPPVTDVTAPDIPDVPEKVKAKDLPNVTLTNTDDMVKYMQLEQMHADGIDIKSIPPDKHQEEWGKYQAGVTKGAAGLNKDDVAQDGAVKPHSSVPDSNDSGAVPGDGVEGALNVIDFSPYGVYDVVVTPYKDVFDALRWGFHAAPSRTGLYLARIHMFIMTRQLIGSYLNFLASLPSVVTGGWVTTREARAFEEVLQKYSGWVSDEFVRDATRFTSEGGYHEIVGAFNVRLDDKGEFANGRSVYDCFVANFRFLSNAPYGFLLTTSGEGGLHYPQFSSWVIYTLQVAASANPSYPPALTKWNSDLAVSTGSMASSSYRVYPIIVGGATPGIGLAFYVPEYEVYGWCAIYPPSTLVAGGKQHAWELFEEDGNPGKLRARSTANGNHVLSVGNNHYFSGAAVTPATLTPINFADVEGGTIHGIPMWYELPFKLVQESVLNGFE